MGLRNIGLPFCIVAMMIAFEGQAGAQDQPTPTTANFLKMCSAAARRSACKDLLSEFLLDNSEPCVPTLDAVLVELRAHPDLRTQSWTDGVGAAVTNICAHPR
jgi:hypothetical protein